MLSRKRDDFEQSDYGSGPMTKKIKSPLSSTDQLKVNDYNDDDVIFVNDKSPKYELNDDTFNRGNAIELGIVSETPTQVKITNRERETNK